MNDLLNPFNTLAQLSDKEVYYSLPALEKQGFSNIRRLPVSLRILLESLLRNCDGKLVTEQDVRLLAGWTPGAVQKEDIPFVVARVLLQDFTGVPLLVDLAAMRDVAVQFGFDPRVIEPMVPVDLVIDHSVQVDRAGTDDAFLFNLKVENERNLERYSFLKWGQHAFNTLKIVPPGIGICHQVNLEYLATIVSSQAINGKILLYPDTVVGTDSHTTMVNGLGVLGWGVGGIEAEAAMLGQPVAMQIPEVVGVCLSGSMPEGSTATDLTLRLTEILRKAKVVGKFVEFFGEGVSSLSVADRATIANMAPEYGATMGFFPVDERTLEYLRLTGRSQDQIRRVKEYLEAQQLFGVPLKGELDYNSLMELDLSSIRPAVAGPKRPQDRIDLKDLKTSFKKILTSTAEQGGYGINSEEPLERVCVHAAGSFSLNSTHQTGGTPLLADSKGLTWSEEEMVTNRPLTDAIVDPGYMEGDVCDIILSHGSVAIAAITSCTNTSNPSVMIAAGLLAKKAVERGLKVNRMVKTSLAPGSRVVTDYLEKSGLQKYLDALGFQLVAYGCTTCIGNSGPLEERIEKAIKDHDLVAASVLSGNRNFEARVNSALKANFLMSPPLVVAFAIAGRIDFDMEQDPLGHDQSGQPVFLRDIWPSSKQINEVLEHSLDAEMFRTRYNHVSDENELWKEIPAKDTPQYNWDQFSTYIQKPPYFDKFTTELPPTESSFVNMRPLAMFGDSVTTDHISPAGAFRVTSPAGKYLSEMGIKESDFNSYGSRRGNHNVMMRGTFANVRIVNKLADGKEGGYTKLMPEGTILPIFEACEAYQARGVPLIVFAGKDYGMGSSRDWAAKGPMLLGVKVAVAQSFERIHRSNLIGMGILPLQFMEGDSVESLQFTGDELFTLHGLGQQMAPRQQVTLEIVRGDSKRQVKLLLRLDTPSEVEYYRHGGILPYVVRQLLK